MKRNIPNYFPVSRELTADRMNIKEGYKIEAFNIHAKENFIKVAQDEFNFLLKFQGELPTKDLAATLAHNYANSLCVRRLRLDIRYLKDMALQIHIDNYLKSCVFNLRTLENIRPHLCLAAGRVLTWFYSLPKDETEVEEEEMNID